MELELCSLHPLCTRPLTHTQLKPKSNPKSNPKPITRTMARNRPKWYVVTVGVEPGIYTSWL